MARKKKIGGAANIEAQQPELQNPGSAAPADDPSIVAQKEAQIKDAARVKLANEYRRDFKRFYCELLASNVDTTEGLPWSKTWGKIHDLLADVLTLDLDDVQTYTNLKTYVKKSDAGVVQERWLHWRSLALPPELQDGADGPISTRFYKEAYQGTIIRLKGDLLSRGVYLPRGHLKSEIATKAFTLWEIVRDPSLRNLMLACVEPLSENFTTFFKNHIEKNERFRAVFGDLKPALKGEAWDKESLQVACPFEQRRGTDPTVIAAGVMSEITGMHVNRFRLDDVVTEKNTKNDEQIKKTNFTLNNLTPVGDPGSKLFDIGTPWEEGDYHSRHTRMDSSTTFITATVVDGDVSGDCKGPAGPGRPLWPEVFTKAEIERRRGEIKDDRFWFGQYFCQFHNSTARVFRLGWLQKYGVFRNASGILINTKPDTVARKEKLAVFCGFVTGLGRLHDRIDADNAAAIVIGQKLNGGYYLLDGFYEKLSLEESACAVLLLALKWRKLATEWDGHFRLGTEATEYDCMSDAFTREMRERGIESHVHVETLKHTKLTMLAGVRNLQPLYSKRQFQWPGQLMVTPISGDQNYSLLWELEEQYTKYPSLRSSELMVAMSYAVQLSQLPEFKESAKKAAKERTGSEYYRDEPLDGDIQDVVPALGGFDDETVEWE